jgi:hypothetical protein
MLPYIGPEMFEWLRTWGAQPEDLSTREVPTAELNHDSSDNETTGK